MVAWTIRSIFLAFPQLYCEVFSEVFVVVNDDLAHFPLPPQTDKLISPGLSEQVPTCLFLFPSLLFLHFAGIVVPRTLRAQRGDSGLAKFWLEYWEFGNYCMRNMNETKATSPCSFRLRMCGLTRSKFMLWRAHEKKRLVTIRCPNMAKSDFASGSLPLIEHGSSCWLRFKLFWWKRQNSAKFNW